MSKSLLVVESPAKAKTLNKYLGADYEVLASYGHVRDLIRKNGAVDPDHDFAMEYEILENSLRHVNAISKALKKADTLYLATDPDREGEAISWHLYQILQDRGDLQGKQVKRVVFHEITKRAIQHAVDNPRDVAMDLVNAQQARRALDYLVGFNLSPLLWRKVRPGLSAGRVQSPALRMIVEREREIEAFVAQEYWKVRAEAEAHQGAFQANLSVYRGQKVKQFTLNNEADTQQAIAILKQKSQGKLTVGSVEAKERKRYPTAPFITSTLQQEAARKLRYSAQRTMRLAQRLYEEGFITYMRTDSVNLAQEAVADLRGLIKSQYGNAYLPAKQPTYTTKSKNAQEAHEAIRPTDCQVEAEQLSGLGVDERKLYDLIRKRTIASQMSPALMEQVSIDLYVGDEQNQFRATGSTIKFPGFMSVYLEDEDDVDKEEEGLLPAMKVGDEVALKDIIGSQHFTQPPPRYSEASLIKALEEKGIGRPSTYANIISTLLNREYIEMNQRRFEPTTIGKVVNDFLTNHFDRYVDYDFTARLEDELDAVSRGEEEWKPLLGKFWQDFSEKVESKKEIAREEVMQARELGTDPKTGKPVSVRLGRFGPFVQLGSKDDEEKPTFVSLLDGMDFEQITLEEALELFKLPRKLGMTEDGEEIVINVGKYGPYARYGRKYVSLPKDENPLTISLTTTLDLIEEKKLADQQKHIKEIKNGDDILRILNGRFGPYVTNGSINASIPKKIEPSEITLEECLELLEKAKERKAKRGGKAKKAATATSDKPKRKASTSTKTAKKTKTTKKS